MFAHFVRSNCTKHSQNELKAGFQILPAKAKNYLCFVLSRAHSFFFLQVYYVLKCAKSKVISVLFDLERKSARKSEEHVVLRLVKFSWKLERTALDNSDGNAVEWKC
jgi:hypothetical protein